MGSPPCKQVRHFQTAVLVGTAARDTEASCDLVEQLLDGAFQLFFGLPKEAWLRARLEQLLGALCQRPGSMSWGPAATSMMCEVPLRRSSCLQRSAPLGDTCQAADRLLPSCPPPTMGSSPYAMSVAWSPSARGHGLGIQPHGRERATVTSVGFEPPDLEFKLMLEAVGLRAVFALEVEMQSLGKL